MDFLKGADVSVLREVESLGGKFYECGKEVELFSFMKSKGISSIRLRVWNDPYNEQGDPYGGGTSDLDSLLALARRADQAGMSVFLDLHYSDFWCDPAKQTLPKAWRGLSLERLIEEVGLFTERVLSELKDAGITPALVQVGNETTNGFLWDKGCIEHPEALTSLIKAGVRAVRKYSIDTAVLLHVDNGGSRELCSRFYSLMREHDVDYDAIALSYYPAFHGSLEQLEGNLRFLIEEYDKDVVIAETSYGYTPDNPASGQKQSMFSSALSDVTGIPLTPAGQATFMSRLLNLLASIPDGRVRGFYYWEPAWLPVSGSSWATDAGRAYLHSDSPLGNEWANQALFDEYGNALPAWNIIRDFSPARK